VYQEDPALKTDGLKAAIRSLRVIPACESTIEARLAANSPPAAL
jgi:hypothetical protein